MSSSTIQINSWWLLDKQYNQSLISEPFTAFSPPYSRIHNDRNVSKASSFDWLLHNEPNWTPSLTPRTPVTPSGRGWDHRRHFLTSLKWLSALDMRRDLVTFIICLLNRVKGRSSPPPVWLAEKLCHLESFLSSKCKQASKRHAL